MTLASSYAATYWKSTQVKNASDELSSASLEYRKSKELTIPKIAEGQIQGYIILQLSYAVDNSVQKNSSAPPDSFLLDEAYQYVYNDDGLDFNNIKKYDLAKLKATVMKNVNARMGANVVKDVMIQEFNYLSHTDLKKQI
jgi:hypothetical protein